MQAAILCGGEGTRLRPLTDVVPKPLLPLGAKPILEITISRMKDQGFRTFFLMVNYKADMIKSYFGSGSTFDVDIHYFEEKERRGTAGPLSQLRGQVDSPIVVLNADLLTSLNYEKLLKYHQEKEADLTVALKHFQRKIAYGVVEMDENSTILGMKEKPVLSYLINSGIYVVSPSVLDIIPDDGVYAMTALVEDARKNDLHVVGYEFTDPWRDIGRMDDYMKAVSDIENGEETDTDGVFR
ncbi:MAG: sugar phosphate nucleotidyltransferase [Candidatus Thorarchaeota archaeon]